MSIQVKTIFTFYSNKYTIILIYITDNLTLLNLFNVLETTNAPNPVGPTTTNQNSFNPLMNEKMAVNAIQKSLMQVESSVKSPLPVNIYQR